MLRKLRIKFILINMVIVTFMLCVIFGLVYFFTSQNLEQSSLQMMETISMNPTKAMVTNSRKPDAKGADVNLPYFSVLINHAGEATEIGGGFFDMSDETLVETLIQKTYEARTDSGILEDYNFRFLRVQTPMGQCIVYSDITSELAILGNLRRSFGIIGGIAFLVFLGISVLLARWAVKPVEKAWQQQKQFVADASHELKTPLTVILTDAELLNVPVCTEAERLQLSDNIITMSGQMRGLVENLLDLARTDHGIPREQLVKVDMTDLVSNTSMLFEPVFFEDQHLFEEDIAPDIWVKGSEVHLKQLTNILLDNAGRYTPAGGTIRLQLSKTDARNCLLQVINQGDPISDEELANLFKRFYRMDKARSTDGGYGLGLSIAQNIAKEHHGRIWAESRGGYNRFLVELPLY